MLFKYEVKQNIRYRLRLIILLLLLSVTTFFLILQISIYYKSISEINRAKNTYLTVATIEHQNLSIPKLDFINIDILKQLSDNPYVLFIDNRRSLAGVNPKLNHIIDKLYNPGIYIDGKVLSVADKDMEIDIELKVENFITGYIKNLPESIHTTYRKDSPYFINKPALEIGNNYHFMLQPQNSRPFTLIDYYDIDDNKKFYENAYDCAGDLLSSTLIFTSSVDSIQAFHKGAILLKQGRNFDQNDYKNGKVCLVSEEYAKENGLLIGDKVNFHMLYCGFIINDYSISSSISSIAEQQQTVNPDVSDSPQEDFEIVGIYRSYMEKYGVSTDKFYFGLNTIFIPMADYPQEIWDNLNEFQKNDSYTSLVSIIIQTGKERQFIDSLTENGFPMQEYKLTIDDGGYKKLASTLNSMKDNALQFILLFLIAIFAVFILFVYLYLDKSKKSYIIMRMLGVKKSKVTEAVISGLLFIGFTGIIIGTIAGGFLSSKVVEQAYEQAKASVLGTDFSFTGGQEAMYHFSSRVPLPLILIVAGCITILLILFTIAGLKGLEGKKDVKVFLS